LRIACAIEEPIKPIPMMANRSKAALEG